MKKPVLVVMAAGMGSRFGGLKQMTPVDPEGHVIMDFSIFDAKRAGFEKVVCIIKREMEADFEALIGKRIRPHIELSYAYQDIAAVPEGFSVPEGREKPWGTAHAVLSAKKAVDGAPAAVINADDFYGAEAYKAIYDFLAVPHEKGSFAMVGYLVKNTVTESGSVARGVCVADENGYLSSITERLKIYKRPGGVIAFTEDDGETWTELAPDTIVSMNLWGYDSLYMEEAEKRFPAFLEQNLPVNPLKCEYLVPKVTDELIREGLATVKVLSSEAKWYGVTYKEDLPGLKEAVRRMKAEGKYPQELWQ